MITSAAHVVVEEGIDVLAQVIMSQAIADLSQHLEHLVDVERRLRALGSHLFQPGANRLGDGSGQGDIQHGGQLLHEAEAAGSGPYSLG